MSLTATQHAALVEKINLAALTRGRCLMANFDPDIDFGHAVASREAAQLDLESFIGRLRVERAAPVVEREPTAAEIIAARMSAGLTQRECAVLVHVALVTWQQWEAGSRSMKRGPWDLFQRRVLEIAESA